LALHGNNNLQSILALGGVEGEMMAVSIQQSPRLLSLAGLERLTLVVTMRLDNNGNFCSISALSGREQIDNLEVSSNPALVDLAGLQNLGSCGSHYPVGILLIRNNSGLQSISALAGADSVGSLEVTSNPSLVDLAGLHNLRSHVKNLMIVDNSNLRNISALGNIARVTDRLIISKNRKLQNQGFSAISNCFPNRVS
jgi:hypothetical protein